MIRTEYTRQVPINHCRTEETMSKWVKTPPKRLGWYHWRRTARHKSEPCRLFIFERGVIFAAFLTRTGEAEVCDVESLGGEWHPTKIEEPK